MGTFPFPASAGADPSISQPSSDTSSDPTSPQKPQGFGKLRKALAVAAALGDGMAAAGGREDAANALERQLDIQRQEQDQENQRAVTNARQAKQDELTREEADVRMGEGKTRQAIEQKQLDNYQTPDQIRAAADAEEERRLQLQQKYAKPTIEKDQQGNMFSVNPSSSLATPIHEAVEAPVTSLAPPSAIGDLFASKTKVAPPLTLDTGKQFQASTEKPGSETDIDRDYARFLKEKNLPDTWSNKQTFLKAQPKNADEGTWSIIDTDKGPMMFNSKTTQMKPVPEGVHAKGGPEDKFAQANASQASKDVATARSADFRYRSMSNSYDRAIHGDQQAQVNILMNHIGMTLGLQKGARITQTVISEAEKASPVTARILARIGVGGMFDDKNISDALRSGIILTPDQMDSMLALGKSQRENAWQSAVESAKQAGVEKRIQLPSDLQNLGADNGGAGSGGGSGSQIPSRPKSVPPEAVWNAQTRQWRLPTK